MNNREMSCFGIDSNVFVHESHKGLLSGFKLGLVRTQLEWRAHISTSK
jgi:hypothetical protein